MIKLDKMKSLIFKKASLTRQVNNNNIIYRQWPKWAARNFN